MALHALHPGHSMRAHLLQPTLRKTARVSSGRPRRPSAAVPGDGCLRLCWGKVPLKLYFTQTEHDDQIWGSEGCDWAVSMRDQMLQSANTRYEMIDRPEQADIIVFWEPHQNSQVIWIPRLRAHRLVREFPNKVFVVSVEDSPLGLLSGLYTSLPARRHHPHRHRTCLYYRTQNPYLRGATSQPARLRSSPNLASFSGADSHPLRGRLLDLADVLARQGIIITATQRHRFSANPNDPQLKPSQLAYIDAILDAKFSLCPRGNGAGSYRLQESPALGRAPVIISDDWVPVADLDWERFAVFVAENDLHDLPCILREHEARWKEMGDLALQVYESHFSRGVFASRAVEQIVAIYKARTHDERDFFSQWGRMMDRCRRPLGSLLTLNSSFRLFLAMDETRMEHG